jgi:hypothetical protein
VGFQEALESAAPDLEAITAWQQRIAHSFLCLFFTIQACDVCEDGKQQMPGREHIDNVYKSIWNMSDQSVGTLCCEIGSNKWLQEKEKEKEKTRLRDDACLEGGLLCGL